MSDNQSISLKCGMPLILTQRAVDHMRAHEADVSIKAIIETIESLSFQEIMEKTNNQNIACTFTKEFKDYIGRCMLIEDDSTLITLAYRKGRTYYSRVNFDISKVRLYKKVVVVLKPYFDYNTGQYKGVIFLSAWAGEESVKEVYDPTHKTNEELQNSIGYWNKHSLIINKSYVDPKQIITGPRHKLWPESFEEYSKLIQTYSYSDVKKNKQRVL